ncbi:hypothetical protein PHISCL_05278 [Aspergillus sclerotialis]|uniref:Uncharacterized protein n=1 Tax=Aspergillus sclerotialis TaxID=2070753 RepID=A0A3A2ZWK8_9EURO|nr:hypothetical protein PHISCL_05278 [Aspergillus sclerotialis]
MTLSLLEHVSIESKTLKWARLAHLCLPSILSSLSGAEVALWIVFWVKYVRNDGSGYNIANRYSILNSVRVIVFFLCSLEALGWVIFCVMPKSAPSQFNTTKRKTRSLLTGSLFFMAFNLALTVIAIRYTLLRYPQPYYTAVALSAVYFVCTIGIYTGLICCCKQWARNVPHSDDFVRSEHALDEPPPYRRFDQEYSFEHPISPISYNQNESGRLGGSYQQANF